MNATADHDFKTAARRAAIEWKLSSTDLPKEARAPGSYRTYESLPFCLPREFASLNLLAEARGPALTRFAAANILWHDGVDGGPSNHLLDSQVQCANALSPYVSDPSALKAIFGGLLPIAEVLPFDAHAGAAHLSPFDETDHVVFEWQGLENHLKEWTGTPTRGSRATSADAAIRYRATDGSIEVALIEWKFTESYPDGLLSTSSTSTETRLLRYTSLFVDSDGPFLPDGLPLTALLGEPVYQLMRLALLAHCIERDHELGADRVRVVYMAPSSNKALWASPGTPHFAEYSSGRSLLDTWASLLRRPDRFVPIDSACLLDATSPVSAEFRNRYSVLAREGKTSSSR